MGVQRVVAIGQVVRIGESVRIGLCTVSRSSSLQRCLVWDGSPSHNVPLLGGEGSPYGENQSTVPSVLEPCQEVTPFLVVGQVRRSVGTSKRSPWMIMVLWKETYKDQTRT